MAKAYRRHLHLTVDRLYSKQDAEVVEVDKELWPTLDFGVRLVNAILGVYPGFFLYSGGTLIPDFSEFSLPIWRDLVTLLPLCSAVSNNCSTLELSAFRGQRQIRKVHPLLPPNGQAVTASSFFARL